MSPARSPQRSPAKETAAKSDAESGAPAAPPAPPADPATCPIVPGHETLIEIAKGSTGLGLSIVGGCDTLLKVIIIHEVYKDGAAAQDGRLWAGDHIVAVNDTSLREITHDAAIKVLRSTGAKVKMRVFRDEKPMTEEDLYDFEVVELVKKQNKGLGISIVGRKDNEGVFISDIVKGGAADSDGRLQAGDQIIAINDEDMKKASQTHVATTLKSTIGRVSLKVGRLKVGTTNRLDGSLNMVGQKGAKKGKASVRQVALSKGPKGKGSLGLSIVGGKGSAYGDIPCIISHVTKGSPADLCGEIQVGDQILTVNGEPVTSASLGQVLDFLKKSVEIELELEESPPELKGLANKSGDTGGSSVHSQSSSSTLPRRRFTEPTIMDIVLDRTNSALGFTIVGGKNSPKGDIPIYVKTVYDRGAAAEDGRLRRGDQILSVNDESFEDVTHDEAVAILKRAKGKVRLNIVSYNEELID